MFTENNRRFKRLTLEKRGLVDDLLAVLGQ